MKREGEKEGGKRKGERKRLCKKKMLRRNERGFLRTKTVRKLQQSKKPGQDLKEEGEI